VAEVLAGACVGEGIGTFSVKAQRIIQLAIGEQPPSEVIAEPRNWSIRRSSKPSLSAPYPLHPVRSVVAAPFDPDKVLNSSLEMS